MAQSDAFEQLTRLAAALFDAQTALITVVDEDRVWFRARHGYCGEEASREESFCATMMGTSPETLLIVEDAALDLRFQNYRAVTQDGLRFYAGALITTADGQPNGSICVIDTVPRPAPTEAQREGLRLLASLAGQQIDQARHIRNEMAHTEMLQMAELMAGVGSWRLDVPTGQVTWSDEVYRIYGKTRETFDPSLDDAVACYHRDDREAVRRWCEDAIRTGKASAFLMRLIRDDGEERVVTSHCRPERDETGTIIALVGVFQDVTDRVRDQQRIEASEARYRLLADRASDVIVTYGTDGVIRYISPAVEPAIGIAPGDLVGRPVTELILNEDMPRLTDRFREIVKAEPDTILPGIVYRARVASGEVRWMEARTTPVRDETGRVVEFQDVVRDVTERKRLEDDLIAARDVAEAAAQAKSDFLANMSHELRTPLTSVIGFAGLLRASKSLPEAERHYAERIATASDALLGVINDILDYSKLEADAVDLDPVAFDPATMVREAASIIESQCEAKGLTVSISTSQDLPTALMGDKGRLRQVTLNFLSNAMKFTASGEIRLDVSAIDGRLRVAVSDSGIGISAGKLESLFDRFTQADASTTRVYGGTGLGLAICQRLIEVMGGEIGVTSEPGRGSTFWFEVPMVQAEATDEQPAELSGGLPAGLRVLMADDAAPNRELVRILLQAWDVELQAVSDGAEAVQAAARGGYDLILMDVHMPVMDGMNATRAIRALGGAVGSTPILALTANVQPEQVAACRAAGMDGHVGKPIRITELIGRMTELLNRTPEAVQQARAVQV